MKLQLCRWIVSWARMLYGLVGVLTLGRFLDKPIWAEDWLFNLWLTPTRVDEVEETICCHSWYDDATRISS